MSWRARITINGKICGSGFLIDEHHVLTCAHLLDEGKLEVVFLGAGGLTSGATVAFRGPHTDPREIGPGDVAVLKLHKSLGIPPAVFAPFETVPRFPTRCYDCFGYPKGFDNGSLAEVFVRPTPRMFGEACTLNTTPYSAELRAGFSGSAVNRKGTQEVVGMLTSTSTGGVAGIGLMLPTDVLCGYWEPLNDLIPLGPIAPHGYRELRNVLTGARIPSLKRIYGKFRRENGPADEDLSSVTNHPMAAIESLVELGDDEDTKGLVASFLLQVGEGLEAGSLKDGLKAWHARHLLGWRGVRESTVRPEAQGDQAYIVIRIDTTRDGGDLRHVTIWPVSGPHNEFHKSVIDDNVPVQQLQETIQEKVKAAVSSLHGMAVQIELVVPDDELNLAAHLWKDLNDRKQEFRLSVNNPLFLRSLAVFEGERTAYVAQRVAKLRKTTIGDVLQWRDCDHRLDSLDHFESELRDDQPLAMALNGEWAHLSRVKAVVNASIPMIVWQHDSSCAEGHETSCTAEPFRLELTKAMDGVRLGDVAKVVRKLRAAVRPGQLAFQCGHDLVLFLETCEGRDRDKLSMGGIR